MNISARKSDMKIILYYLMYSNLRLYFHVFGYPLATQNKKIPIFANKGI